MKRFLPSGELTAPSRHLNLLVLQLLTFKIWQLSKIFTEMSESWFRSWLHKPLLSLMTLDIMIKLTGMICLGMTTWTRLPCNIVINNVGSSNGTIPSNSAGSTKPKLWLLKLSSMKCGMEIGHSVQTHVSNGSRDLMMVTPHLLPTVSGSNALRLICQHRTTQISIEMPLFLDQMEVDGQT